MPLSPLTAESLSFYLAWAAFQDDLNDDSWHTSSSVEMASSTEGVPSLSQDTAGFWCLVLSGDPSGFGPKLSSTCVDFFTEGLVSSRDAISAYVVECLVLRTKCIWKMTEGLMRQWRNPADGMRGTGSGRLIHQSRRNRYTDHLHCRAKAPSLVRTNCTAASRYPEMQHSGTSDRNFDDAPVSSLSCVTSAILESNYCYDATQIRSTFVGD
jgi:hypothetical protein